MDIKMGINRNYPLPETCKVLKELGFQIEQPTIQDLLDLLPNELNDPLLNGEIYCLLQIESNTIYYYMLSWRSYDLYTTTYESNHRCEGLAQLWIKLNKEGRITNSKPLC